MLSAHPHGWADNTPLQRMLPRPNDPYESPGLYRPQLDPDRPTYFSTGATIERVKNPNMVPNAAMNSMMRPT